MKIFIGCEKIHFDYSHFFPILVKNDPKGLICGHCGQINDHHDEEWFYVDSLKNPDIQLPCCSRCWKNEVGISFKEKGGHHEWGPR